MANTSRRSAEEIEGLLAGYEQSGLTQRQYCEQQGIKMTAFDYYRRRRKQGQRTVASATPLVKVELAGNQSALAEQHHSESGFTLVLSKGRRIESSWNFAEQDLARLIRIVEAG